MKDAERAAGYFLGVIENLQYTIDLQRNDAEAHLSLYPWDIQVITTGLVRLAMDLRNPDQYEDTTRILTDNLQREHKRELSIGLLPFLTDR